MGAIENRGPQLQGVAYALLAIAFVSLLLRCYCRILIVKNFGGDDWMMVLAMISFILFVSCALVGVHYGTGRHFTDLKPEDASTAMMYWWFCYVWYCITMIFSKASIGYFLLKIVIDRTQRIIIYAALSITVLWGAIFFLVTVLQCKPVSFFWTRLLPGTPQPGTCLDIMIIEAITYVYSAFSIISDFTFAILPMFLVWKLQMERRMKIVLVPILSMGCIASVAVAVRFGYIKKFSDPDFLYSTVDIAIWSTTEQGLGIAAGSLATLRPLFRKAAAHISTRSGQSGQQDSSHLSNDIVTIGKISRQKKSRNSMDLETNIVQNDIELESVQEYEQDSKQRNSKGGESQIKVNMVITRAQQ
ncbi:hypothetical protein TrVGV298_003349 [Trichoderma virens]|nr:hypothetical protein TrVGV298_003349 [Trichoderma virens]